MAQPSDALSSLRVWTACEASSARRVPIKFPRCHSCLDTRGRAGVVLVLIHQTAAIRSTLETRPRDAVTAAGHNRWLMLLPDHDREHVLTLADRRRHFATSFIGSVLIVLADGTEIETGAVGNEGFIGVPVLLGVDAVPGETIRPVAGEGLVVRMADLQALLAQSQPLRDVLQRCTSL